MHTKVVSVDLFDFIHAPELGRSCSQDALHYRRTHASGPKRATYLGEPRSRRIHGQDATGTARGGLISLRPEPTFRSPAASFP